ncbi:MAG: YihY family inner membrane protein [Syntrophaceae bacterium]|nr:YihY family inner membrane protein [Syntrophaceae bacterium]
MRTPTPEEGPTNGAHRSRSILHRIQMKLASAWDVLVDSVINYQNNGDVNQAAAIAFYAILSFLPLFILTFLVVGYVFSSHPEVQRQLIEGIQRFHPYFTGDILIQLGQLDEKSRLLGWVGFITLIWFSSMIFGAAETAFNLIYRTKTIRNYVVSKLLSFAMIPAAWAVGVLSLGITTVATVVANQPVLADSLFTHLPILKGFLFRYVLPYIVTVIFFTIVYKVIPVNKITLGLAFTGSAVFSALMEVAKHFFAWYIANYTRYHIIFGSLETVVILIIWVFYVALIFLFCAELMASYRRRDLILIERALLKPGAPGMKVWERLFRRFGIIYPPGGTIFQEGDDGRDMYFILAGRIRLERKAGRVRKILAEMGPGEYFGEMATLLEAPRTATASALEESDVAVIDGGTLRRLLRENDEMSMFMLKEFSQRIRHTDALVDELSQWWLRLVAILYLNRSWPLPADADPVAEIAACCGRDLEEIRDVLADLGEQGVVDFREGRLTRFDPERAWEVSRTHIY